MNKSNVKTLKIGLRRVVVALITMLTFTVAAAGFVAVAFLKSYLAVLVFNVSLVVLFIAFAMLYGQGLSPKTYTESKGEKK